MQENDTSFHRALKALLEELGENDYAISIDLVQSIYRIEEKVQFLDERGPISDRISKLVQSEIDKEL